MQSWEHGSVLGNKWELRECWQHSPCTRASLLGVQPHSSMLRVLCALCLVQHARLGEEQGRLALLPHLALQARGGAGRGGGWRARWVV